MNDDHDLPIDNEKPKNKPKRGARSRWLIAWLALGLALSGVLVFLNAPRMVGQPEPTMTWTWWPQPTYTPTMPPAVAATVFAPQSFTYSPSSVSAWGNQLAQVEWKKHNLRWRSFTADDSSQWSVTSGGVFQFPHPIAHAAISADGRWLLVQVVNVTSLDTHFIRTDGLLTRVEENTLAAALSPDGQQAVIIETSGRTFRSTPTDSALGTNELPLRSSEMRTLALRPDMLVALDGTTLVRYAGWYNATITTTPLLDTDQTYNALALLPDGEVAALTTAGVTVYDMAGGYRRYDLDRRVVMQRGVLIASGTQPRLAVLHANGVTVIRVDDGSPLTPDANQAAVTFWPMEGVKSAAFVDAFDLLVVSTSSGLHLMRDGQIVTTLPDKWPIDPIGQPSGR